MLGRFFISNANRPRLANVSFHAATNIMKAYELSGVVGNHGHINGGYTCGYRMVANVDRLG